MALTVHKGLWDLEAYGAAFNGYEARGDVPSSRKWGQRLVLQKAGQFTWTVPPKCQEPSSGNDASYTCLATKRLVKGDSSCGVVQEVHGKGETVANKAGLGSHTLPFLFNASAGCSSKL